MAGSSPAMTGSPTLTPPPPPRISGSLLGSVPVWGLIYSFFVKYYVSSMTGAVKE